MNIPLEVFATAIGALPAGWVSRPDVLVLLYVGPDQILPLTSMLAAITGILLMFWNRALGLLRSITKLLSRREPPQSPTQET